MTPEERASVDALVERIKRERQQAGWLPMTTTTIDLTALTEAYRVGLQNSSDWELDYEARRNAALPPSPLATEIRHLIDAEREYRQAQRHGADDPPVRPSPTSPWPNPPQLPPLPRVDGLAELHEDTVALLRGARADREALERAVAKARQVSNPTYVPAVA